MTRRTAAVVGLVLVIASAAGAVPARAAAAEVLERRVVAVDGRRLTPELEAVLADASPGQRLEVIVTAIAGSGPPAVARALAAVGDFDVASEWALIDGFSATMTAAQVGALSRLPWVRRIELPQVFEALNDDAQAGFGVDDARAEYGHDGSGVVICVLDTGIRADHEQFNGPGGSKVVGWKDFIAGGATPYDGHGHGTHVAGTAAGDGEGPSSLAATYGGVAPGASLVIGKVLTDGGSSSGTSVEDGIDWCADDSIASTSPDWHPPVDVISMSLGTASASAGTDALSAAVNAAVAGGITVVVAAGNSGAVTESVGSPGAAADAITVGAVADPGEGGVYLAPFSSRGPTLAPTSIVKPDIVAPGVSIASAYVNSTASYGVTSGTSMSTPFVAGVAALGLQAAPGATPAVLKSTLESTAADWGPAGKDVDWGAGLIDVHAFIGALEGDSRTNGLPVHVRLDDQEARNGATWTHGIVVDPADVGEPLAATIVIDGSRECVIPVGDECWGYGSWDPDMDARLRRPDGSVAATQECPLTGDCGPAGTGRQETFHVTADQPGTWTLEVWPWDADPGDGVPAPGGTFDVDLSVPTAPAPPPPPPPPPPAPDAPTLSSAVAGGPDRIDLAWSSVAGAATYTVEHSVDGASWDPAPLATGLAGTSYSHDGLAAGSEHHYRVLAVNDGGSSPPSNVDGDITPPETPANLAAATQSTSAILVDWDAAGGATEYLVEHSPDAGVTWAAEATVFAPVSNYTDSGLAPDSVHHYRVRAANGGPHLSGWSNVASAATDPDVPPPPPPPDPVDDVTTADLAVQATVEGTHVATHASDDSRQALTEVESGGRPDKRRSSLEHRWTLDVSGGDQVTLYVEAHHTANSEGDDFTFSFSADGGASFADLLTVTKIADDDVAQGVGLPAGTSGQIIVRVVDTDNAQGNRALDTLYVDHLFVRSEAAGPPTDPPPPPPPAAISLTATGYKVKGAHTVDLSWSGASGSTIDIWRDGTLIATVANGGGHTDPIGTKGGGVSHAYQVCEAGTTTCSGEVVVTF